MFYSVPGGWLLFVYSWHSCMSSYWQDILLTHCIVLSVSGILHPLRQNLSLADFFLNFSQNILEIGVHGIRCFRAYSPYDPFFNCFAFIKEMSTSCMLPTCVTTKPCMELLFLWRTLIGPVTFWTTWKQIIFYDGFFCQIQTWKLFNSVLLQKFWQISNIKKKKKHRSFIITKTIANMSLSSGLHKKRPRTALKAVSKV